MFSQQFSHLFYSQEITSLPYQKNLGDKNFLKIMHNSNNLLMKKKQTTTYHKSAM